MEDLFWWIVLVGFLAQLVDGALGMAYGLTSTALLISMGFPPAAASATVHAAEVVTTGAAGTAHHFAGSVDWKLARKLAIAGSIGGVVGALLLSSGLGKFLAPLVALYLAVLGGLVLLKALRPIQPPAALSRTYELGLVGGFLDAIGGGGWGPIVSSTLVFRGDDPRRMLGTSLAAEFFVTSAISVAFMLRYGFENFGMAALALVIGGLPAAPLAALVIRAVPRRGLMIAVGLLIIVLGLIGVVRFLRELMA